MVLLETTLISIGIVIGLAVLMVVTAFTIELGKQLIKLITGDEKEEKEK